MVSLETLQYIFAGVIWITTIIGNVLPLFVVSPTWISRCEAGTGGVFLGGALAHLLDDSYEKFNEYNEGAKNPIEYPLPPGICLGTFAVLTIIELFTYSESDATKEVYGSDNEIIEEEDQSEEVSLNDIQEEQVDSKEDENKDQAVKEDSQSVKEVDDVEKDKTVKKGKKRMIEFGKDFSKITGNMIALYCVLCIHSALTGLSLGIIDDEGSVIGIFAAIVGHKPLESFALSMIILKDKPKPWFFALMVFIFSLFTPLAVVAGVKIQNEGDDLKTAYVTAFSAGTFLTVGCHEWSQMVSSKSKWTALEKFWHILFFCIGMLWMLLIALVPGA